MELSRLYEGRQLTYGSARARVQRALYRAGLVIFANEDGTPAQTIEEADLCCITAEGRVVFETKG